jgi:hypothetical protein
MLQAQKHEYLLNTITATVFGFWPRRILHLFQMWLFQYSCLRLYSSCTEKQQQNYVQAQKANETENNIPNLIIYNVAYKHTICCHMNKTFLALFFLKISCYLSDSPCLLTNYNFKQNRVFHVAKWHNQNKNIYTLGGNSDSWEWLENTALLQQKEIPLEIWTCVTTISWWIYSRWTFSFLNNKHDCTLRCQCIIRHIVGRVTVNEGSETIYCSDNL